MASLSVVIIAKDNEKTIDDVLRSAKRLSGDIVVVDTGAKDRTMQIAKGYGARVVRCPLPFNYSKARNVGSDAATGEWVFHLDTDEQFDESFVPVVHQATNQNQWDHFLMEQVDCNKNLREIGEFFQERLFRRSMFRYSGLTYESLHPVKIPGYLDAFISHFPDYSISTKKFTERIEFSKREYEELKKMNVSTELELGNVIDRISHLRGFGFESMDVYRTMLSYFQQGLKNNMLSEAAMLRVVSFFGMGGMDDSALEILNQIPKSVKSTTHSHMYWSILAIAYIKTGDQKKSLRAINQAIQSHSCARYYKYQAMIQYAMGNEKAAMSSLDVAIQRIPNHPRYCLMKQVQTRV